MSATIFLEGGGNDRELRFRCQLGFRRLLERCGFAGRMPKLVARGGRNAAYDAFQAALTIASDDKLFLWVDSEDPIDDIEATWEHLRKRDGWKRPKGATNEQVLSMTTCMETLIVADRDTLSEHYGADLQVSALPSLTNMETRSRTAIQDALVRATRECTNAYTKGKRSFEILSVLDPDVLGARLPSFARTRRILDEMLK